MINQLFIKSPPEEIIIDCLCALGFSDIDDKSFISKTTMEHARSVDIIKRKTECLKQYYTPSKAKKYLVDIDLKKCITIVKQLIRVIGYDLISKEKMSYGKKVLYYRIITSNDKKKMKQKTNTVIKPTVILFD